jgi:Protein of unknown function (DUF1353)
MPKRYSRTRLLVHRFVDAAASAADQAAKKRADCFLQMGQGVKFAFIPEELPWITPFFDWDMFYITKSLEWSPPPIHVPSGFLSDLASIPKFLHNVAKPTERHAHAAIVHDYLYWEQSIPRH